MLDTDCTTHDLPDLSVVDASFMPAMGATNPTLSIIANAIRVGRHLADADDADDLTRSSLTPLEPDAYVQVHP